MRMVTHAAVLCLAILLAAPSSANAGDVVRGVEQARVQLVRDLEAVAKWCTQAKLFGRRDEVYERILEFDLDHAEARKRLKFERGPDGAWLRNPRYKRPFNARKNAMPEADRRMAAAFERYDAVRLEICSQASDRADFQVALGILRELARREPEDEKVDAALRRALMAHATAAEAADQFDLAAGAKEELARRYPDDPAVRTFIGEVRMDDRWVLPETVASLDRRKALAVMAKEILSRTPRPSKGTLTEAERNTGLPWNDVFVTPHVRVVGTSTSASLRTIAHRCEAAAPFFERVMRRAPQRNPVFTFVVFEQKAHWHDYLAKYEPLLAADREAARASRLSGYSFADGRYAIRHVGAPAFELDLAVDVIFQHFLLHTYARWDAVKAAWTPLRGWVVVGLSDYLTFRLIGTRLLTTVGGSYSASAEDFLERVPDLQRKWLAGARELMERDGLPGTHLLLGKYLGSFAKDDAVTAYGLAGYFVEGQGGKVDALLTSTGLNRPPEESLGKTMSLSVSALHARLARWLGEMGEAK